MTSVLVVTSMYPPHHYGGYELSCRDVVRRFRAAGHTVDIIGPQRGQMLKGYRGKETVKADKGSCE